MKGMGKLLSMFIKIMEIGFIVMAVLITYFDIANYSVNMDESINYREVRLIGEALLSCSDLTVISNDGYPVKGLFDKNKLSSASGGTPSCIKFSRDGYSIPFKMEILTYTVGDSSILNNAMNTTFPVAIKYSEDDIQLSTMRVYLP